MEHIIGTWKSSEELLGNVNCFNKKRKRPVFQGTASRFTNQEFLKYKAIYLPYNIISIMEELEVEVKMTLLNFTTC